MRPTAIVSETWRNLATGTTRALVLGAVLALAASGAGLFEAATITSLQQRAARWQSSRAAIHTLAADQDVDGASCIALPRARGTTGHPITAAGALAAGPTLTVAATPASSLPTFTVTPDLAGVLGLATTSGDGVWISDQLATTLTAVPGDHLDTDRGPMTVAAVFPWPDDGRDQRIAYAILLPTATRARYDECWATVASTAPSTIDLLHTVNLVHPDAATATPIGQINNTLGTSQDAWTQYQHRPGRYAGPLLPLAALALGYLAARTRRLENASALHAGLPRTAQFLTGALETLAWTIPALATAAAVTAAGASIQADQDTAGDLLVGQLPALAGSLATAQLGVLAALTLTKERHLFAYFKER